MKKKAVEPKVIPVTIEADEKKVESAEKPKARKPDEVIRTPKQTTAIVPVKQTMDAGRFARNMAKLKQILDLVFKKEDVRNRLSSILNPEKPQTSSKLSAEQVNFVTDAFWFADMWPELYNPLKTDAENLLLTQLSENGYGVERAIDLTGRIEGSQMMKAMFGSVTTEKKHRLPGFNKGGTKQ